MTPFLTYLIKSSVSLALLYCLFRVTVRNDKNHRLTRFLLLSIMVLTATIPFLTVQLFYKEIEMASSNIVREIVSAPVGTQPAYNPAIIYTPVADNVHTVNYWAIIYIAIISLLLFRLLHGIYRISGIIKKAEKHRFRKIVLAVVKEVVQPFTFLNKVVLSEKDFLENKAIVVAHEYAHIRHKHAFDLLLCELFTALHFFNPFMWLLRRDLKLVHEYQADEAVLNTGIDAQKYQLLVLEKAVGERRFAMAHHFTQKPIVKRLKMMTKTKCQKWGMVKMILFVPLIIVLLQAFARPDLITKSADFIPVRYTENKAEQWLAKWNIDNIGNGFFDPETDRNKLSEKENNVLVILMNIKDEYLVQGEQASKESIKSTTSGFLQGVNPDGNKGPDFIEKEISGIGKVKVSEGWISYRNDIESSREAINFTLRKIGEAYLEAREAKAFVLFGKKYFDLDEEKQKTVNEIVPIRFSYETPKNPRSNAYLPFEGKYSNEYPPFNIVIKNPNEIYVENYKYTSLESFIESIQQWNDELDAENVGKRSLSKCYDANLFIQYPMPQEVWNRLQLALHRNSIHIQKFQKESAYKVIWLGAKKRLIESSYKDPKETETRDIGKLYVTLYNDEEIDLTEIRKTALECFDTKKSAIIEIENGIEKKDVSSVKEVLKKCGISDIEIVRLEESFPKTTTTVNTIQPTEKAGNMKRLPWIRFSESLILVNGKECVLSDMNVTLEKLFEEEEIERKVELMLFPASQKERITELTNELKKIHNLEIVQTNYKTFSSPLRYKLLLYPEKIVVNNKEIKMEEVAQLTEEWVEATGIKKAQIHMPELVSVERIDQLKDELRKGGIK